ncbi:hypothetical protein [Labilibaculum antarcticum]|uniref:hypothetical protein n=1 Tax=Labilibaculum antarcticum TaxID=1717717 RepID=UPI0011AB87E3|nr:hypothetical protein [Labilibaculum antarcticum]
MVVEEKACLISEEYIFLPELGNANVYRLFMMIMLVSLWSGGFPGIKRESFAGSEGYFFIMKANSLWSEGFPGIKKEVFTFAKACFLSGKLFRSNAKGL